MGGAVIIGAGLGGLRTAESLRGSGYDGPITIVGDEPHLPYSRPPLSKEALAGGVDVAALEFRRRPALDDVTWLLGLSAVSSDLAARTVTLSDGAVLAFDGLVVASGIRPRRLPIPGPALGRHLLRTADDAQQVRAGLAAGAHVVIMGAGFIGCETAATAQSDPHWSWWSTRSRWSTCCPGGRVGCRRPPTPRVGPEPKYARR